MEDNWRVKHKEIIESFLKYLNDNTDKFVLKGGTALMECYDLNRFSEDIDLDGIKGRNKDIDKIIESFALKNGIPFNHNKNTNTTDRYFLHYNGDSHPLKIETSFRNEHIDYSTTIIKNGIRVYDIDTLAEKKLNAFNQRDKIRDMFDVIFIVKNYWDDLSNKMKSMINDAFSYKGIDYYETLCETQTDELIDKIQLEEDFISIWDKVGLSEDDDKNFEEINYDYDYDNFEE